MFKKLEKWERKAWISEADWEDLKESVETLTDKLNGLAEYLDVRFPYNQKMVLPKGKLEKAKELLEED